VAHPARHAVHRVRGGPRGGAASAPLLGRPALGHARLNQIPAILTEDFADGGVLEGVRFVNPFADAFDVAALG